jgi:hypothetical protein
MERRLSEAIASIAAMITGAWEAAGKPVIVVNPTATAQQRRRQ